MMFCDRVKQLQTVSIPNLVQEIFQSPVNTQNIGFHDDLRNYVIKVEDNYILKVYGDKIRWKRELENLTRIHKSDFKIPLLIDYGMANPENGWVLMGFLTGKEIEEYYKDMNQAKRSNLWYRLGELLANFHKNNITKSEDAHYFDNQTNKLLPISYWQFVVSRYMYNKKKIVEKNYYDEPSIYKAAFNDLEHCIMDTDNNYVLCHNDFSLRNILYDTALDTYSLIDFESGMLGQHEADFARVLLDLMPQGYADEFLNGYYKKNDIFVRDNKKIRIQLLYKIVEICSWSYERARSYYDNTFIVLKSLYDPSNSII